MQYGFKARFVLPIELGTKQQTIRKPRAGRSRHAQRGDLLQLSTGDRFHPHRIGLARCLFAGFVRLDLRNDEAHVDGFVDTAHLYGAKDLDAFAVVDGFEDWADLRAFWAETHDGPDIFEGVRIFWGSTFAGPLDPPPADVGA